VKYNFVNLKDLENVPKDSVIGTSRLICLYFVFILSADVIAVVKEFKSQQEIVTKATSKTVNTILVP
jgi:hypothetical protein